jgi:hypothetical protein
VPALLISGGCALLLLVALLYVQRRRYVALCRLNDQLRDEVVARHLAALPAPTPDEKPEKENAPQKSTVFSRFPTLLATDAKYALPTAAQEDVTDMPTLPEICDHLRYFAVSRFGYAAPKAFWGSLLGAMSISHVLFFSGDGTENLVLESTALALQEKLRTASVETIYEAQYEIGPKLLRLSEIDPFAGNIKLTEGNWPMDPRFVQDGVLTISRSVWFVGKGAEADRFTPRRRAECFFLTVPKSERIPTLMQFPRPMKIDHRALNAVFDGAAQLHPPTVALLRGFTNLETTYRKCTGLAFPNGTWERFARYAAVCIDADLTAAQIIDSFGTSVRFILQSTESSPPEMP